jgi:hypothetical protein
MDRITYLATLCTMGLIWYIGAWQVLRWALDLF